ncbi:hypothetical protein [uncultured Roseovarius sp.]|uniref:hypothetical protein n=1 Tax=uncultured Roseovarius sp. TaxID=293344 RepID=UPI0026315EEF|nr:hypothetical protein [uncultured Roseovarius sp.]
MTMKSSKLFALLCSATVMAISAPQRPAEAQACTPDLKADEVLDSDTEALAVGLRWCGLIGAPSVDDPSLVGETSFKDMLWRRHERASECIWIPQCRITLRSAAGVVKDDYQQIADIDDPLLDDDDPGDVVIRVPDGPDDGTALDRDYSELRQLWQNCDLAWGEQEKGLLALSLGRFIGRDENDNTVSVGVAGVALDYDDVSDDMPLERPALAVIDPTFVGDANTERTLGHEVGHKLGICHPDQTCATAGDATGSIMDSGAGTILITESQCNAARDRLSGSTQLDPPAGTGDVLGLIDGRGDPDEANIPDLMDIRKIVAVDDTERGEGLRLVIRLQGALGANQVLHLVAMDTDNDSTTGAPLAPLVPNSTLTGVDLAVLAQANENGVGPVQVRVAQGNALVVQNVPGVAAIGHNVRVTEHGPDALPPQVLASDMEFTFSAAALGSLGLDVTTGRLFPDGLRVQSATVVNLGDGETFVDEGPNAAAVLGFPDPDFPSVVTAGPACAGDLMGVEVKGLANGREVMAYLGEAKIEPGVVTNQEGDASFDILVPEDAVAGPTLLTVGVKDPTNAVTADTIIDLCPDGGSGGGNERSVYPAKVICGSATDDRSVNFALGRYATTVNVFNPGKKPARLSKALALAVPPGREKPGKVIPIAEREVLPAGQAMAVQCDELMEKTQMVDGDFLDGFVVIDSSSPLIVTAVYSSIGKDGEPGPVIDIEHIAAAP